MVQGYEENGFIPTRHFAQLFDTSLRTVYRALHSEGLHYRRHAIKPLLTEANKRARLEFALKYINFDWSNVIFSDEKTFKSSQHGRVMLWRRNNTRYDSDHVVPNAESGRITVNMWGWMSSSGPGELTVIPSRANSVNYIDVLNDVMLPTVRNVFPVEDMPEISFVQDNCPIHRSIIVQEWFSQQSDIRIIPWPARSPDLNPIENLWGIMVQRWDNRNERTKEALSTHCMQVWDSIRGQNLCEKLINSMSSRLQAVIDQNGGYTKY
ncbi:hypothetical protein PYW07_000141 [Mythimna separata]|uniref:Transposase n=1 Tax=Mythimna separata TaxID=271217 RepID=A0AAD8DZK7_MYTSE|nr:hypothetical protein PYW07_015473 [Mythimna separata]KAJ8735433.1 hypothetical protein PYW07_007053 [Mythimna separata]KAJ8735488.1 hypothetical protein PYW07_007108 [Mythimna separata]KAJ8736870.1 hypothetical protein PYW07_000141 [Mythimna separata]